MTIATKSPATRTSKKTTAADRVATAIADLDEQQERLEALVKKLEETAEEVRQILGHAQLATEVLHQVRHRAK